MNPEIAPPPGAVFARNKPGCMMLCSRCQTWHLAASHEVLPSGARSATCGHCSGLFALRAVVSKIKGDPEWEAELEKSKARASTAIQKSREYGAKWKRDRRPMDRSLTYAERNGVRCSDCGTNLTVNNLSQHRGSKRCLAAQERRRQREVRDDREILGQSPSEGQESSPHGR